MTVILLVSININSIDDFKEEFKKYFIFIKKKPNLKIIKKSEIILRIKTKEKNNLNLIKKKKQFNSINKFSLLQNDWINLIERIKKNKKELNRKKTFFKSKYISLKKKLSQNNNFKINKSIRLLNFKKNLFYFVSFQIKNRQYVITKLKEIIENN